MSIIEIEEEDANKSLHIQMERSTVIRLNPRINSWVSG
jgi:hypothetical protein